MSYLVDTSWAVEYLRNNRVVQERLQFFRDEGLFISVISVAELYRGVFRSTNPLDNESHLHDFLRGVSVLGITQDITRIFGVTDNTLRRRGDTVAEFDLLIASTALHHDLILRYSMDLKEGDQVTILIKEGSRVKDEEAKAAFERAAGSWEGTLDFDEFLADLRNSRKRPQRPPVDLG